VGPHSIMYAVCACLSLRDVQTFSPVGPPGPAGPPVAGPVVGGWYAVHWTGWYELSLAARYPSEGRASLSLLYTLHSLAQITGGAADKIADLNIHHR
jgi:hypothetical protein